MDDITLLAAEIALRMLPKPIDDGEELSISVIVRTALALSKAIIQERDLEKYSHRNGTVKTTPF